MKSHSANESAVVFHEILDAFPPGIVELRVNHSEHIIDMDMIANADVLVIGKCGFHRFLQLLPRPSTAIINDKHYSGSLLLEKSVNQETDIKDIKVVEMLLNMFNKDLCKTHHRITEIWKRCAKAGLLDAASGEEEE